MNLTRGGYPGGLAARRGGAVRLQHFELFCGGGGSAVGYSRAYQKAGIEAKIVGVDIKAQPNFPFEFCQGDALALVRKLIEDAGPFVVFHASPPCQKWTGAQKLQNRDHPDLITPLRPLLAETGAPYVIENVVGAPLIDPVLLDGTMFPELHTKRPRLFETNFPVDAPFFRHKVPQPKMGRQPKDHEWIQVVGHFTDVEEGRRAMGIDWMTRDELREAIPPAYTEFIGSQLVAQLERVT